ncbi:SCO family protein [Haloferax mediterranei ATCC 33500]|uniref:Photosynthetic protein synthase I n=1 Tax=Haloferax mediterranei (strain ATCC 33500 / DSM 1411 / JCM 8866 / NBRC 14739 / NCIMB 2177 / R-4) TaxID=523841 RepID=I3R401_HALMT|nr:SCO family protein [Haloferax mediterranei]AFK18961.1 regulatory protein PrrC [Haloferax mediterranei ATCC 33500]AHZ21677.1 photosynthetic protein synthase I [Haloferax mediterranei ATCC 33500]EMA03180.1 regulatory protein PrrC [Haloferax mediterranei ATCC 33500]MDX5989053.1 SCO family protein [Haloferax mediterranei ATCC 33500]QCQ75445.1 SCO family protein [Haloferax mediterranei ATCC 33500]
MNRRTYLRAVGTGAAVGLAGCLGGIGGNSNVSLSKPERENDVTSEDLPYPAWGQQVPDVTLTDPIHETEVSVRDIDGPHFHTFFFTNCMTVCPVLISALREAQIHSISEGYADDVSFYPITFDPARDDAAAFKKEANDMNVDMDAGNWHFLRTADEAEAKDVVEDQFGVFFEKNEPDEDGNYMFTHLGLVMLVNGDGYVERTYRGNQPDEQTLLDDLTALREA